MTIREEYHRMPKPTMRAGVPEAPSYMFIGTKMFALDHTRVVSVTNAGDGRIEVVLVARDGDRDVLGDPDRKPGDTPRPRVIDSEHGGVSFWMTPHTASELVAALGSEAPNWIYDRASHGETSPHEGRRVRKAGEIFVGIDQVAGIHVALLRDKHAPPVGSPEGTPAPATPWHGVDEVDPNVRYPVADTYLFLRAFDTPYALRLHFEREDCDLFVSDVARALVTVSHEEAEDVVERVGQVTVGKMPEETKPTDAPPQLALPAKTDLAPKPDSSVPLRWVVAFVTLVVLLGIIAILAR